MRCGTLKDTFPTFHEVAYVSEQGSLTMSLHDRTTDALVLTTPRGQISRIDKHRLNPPQAALAHCAPVRDTAAIHR